MFGSLAVRTLDLLWPTRPDTWSEAGARLATALANVARLTAASVLAYLLTRWLVSGPIDLTGALTAMLVMQASAASSFKQGFIKVIGVALGIGLALVASSVVGMSWWSLGLLIFLALVLARILRLGDAALEPPISAMLILGSTRGGDVAAEARMVGTLVGTFVGIVLPLLLPPAVPTRSVSAAVRRVAGSEGRVLRTAAKALQEGPVDRAMVNDWLVSTRGVTQEISKANTAVSRLSDVRRFNSRAVGTADIAPILVSGLNSLETCLVSLRAIFLVMERRAPRPAHPSLGQPAAVSSMLTDQMQQMLGRVLDRLGVCLDSFGEMVEAEASGNEAKAHEAFVANYRRLRDARAELAELVVMQEGGSDMWLVGGTIATALDHVIQQLDIDARVRVRERWKASQLGRRLPESTIGPRSTVMDRFRLDRMRARRLRHPEPKEQVSADFMADDEDTQPIPVVRD